ncbi:MAG: T9SS type A sorting domain-containing protein [Bacteroidetes bacterium]|nr:T9SS type A sorting domain-containing protein [Bacteroidota bacterium]
MSFNSENNLVLSGFTYSNSGNVSGNHGQSDIWTVKLTSTASGLNDLSLKNEFKIYPNPVTNYFQFADNSSKKEIEVYSVIGEKLSISSTPDPQNQYDVSQLVPGIYFVKTSDKGVLKLIKIRNHLTSTLNNIFLPKILQIITIRFHVTNVILCVNLNKISFAF